MANPTTNFGWQMPTNSDLVTDLPADFEVFGQAVDTSLADLKGGTTGQVLTKASNTDMDFTWAADASGIPATIFDAKGDLIAASAADTAARLAVGTNGQVLTADSTAATGIKWATPAAGGKVLQVVSATNSTQKNIASTTMTDSNLTATITPTASTSKILVLISQNLYVARSTSEAGAAVQLVRDSTTIFNASGSNNDAAGYMEALGATRVKINYYAGFTYLDSPATTSAVTYKTQGRATTTSNSGEIYFQIGGTTSTITLLEIGA